MATRIIIAGGRDFDDYALLKKECEKRIQGIEGVVIIVSGGAKGADQLGEKFATEKGYKIERFLPDWNSFGKSAGPMRNAAMAAWADILIAFWDGESRGTLDMLTKMKEHKKEHTAIFY